MVSDYLINAESGHPDHPSPTLRRRSPYARSGVSGFLSSWRVLLGYKKALINILFCAFAVAPPQPAGYKADHHGDSHERHRT